MASNKGYNTADRSKAGDERFTPEYAVEPIIKHLKNRGYKTVWCPFDTSESEFVRVLESEGFIVWHSHMKDGFDFRCIAVPECDAIVSNPPYSCKDGILQRLYDIGKPFAMLLPQNTLQGKRRTKMFMEYGVEYLGFDKRICYAKEPGGEPVNGVAFASGYFCKDVLPSPLVFERLEIR